MIYISPRDYKTFINKLLNDDLKPSYINAILKSHKAFWNYVLDEELIHKSPIEKIKFLKETKDVLIHFNDAEVKRMLRVWNTNKYLSFRNRAIIALLFDTGIRANELISITDDDISDKYLACIL
ncbi:MULTISPECIES: tyrosine-type recombinase/integrase [Lactococcus]|uniref:tyrosine-type recombinase/integrase n=1 Tax=Lactococcus TaxID=1357 RepID=UPI00071CD0CA|nr:tyrosine-type recombinase/integrase [Lactococcus lactis]MDU0398028.1 Tyrosine recombinase XerC [Lactococcus lactis]